MSNVTQRVTCTHSAARGLDIVSRLMAFVMCLNLAFLPTMVYAVTLPPDDGNPWRHIKSSGVKDGLRVVTTTAYKSIVVDGVARRVGGKALVVPTAGGVGGVMLKRILLGTPYALAGVALVSYLLQDDGWTIDKENREIYKLEGGPMFFVASGVFNSRRFPSESAAITNFIIDSTPENSSPAAFSGFSSNWTKPLSDLMPGEFAFRNFKIEGIYTYTLGVEMMPTSKIHITPSEVGQYMLGEHESQPTNQGWTGVEEAFTPIPEDGTNPNWEASKEAMQPDSSQTPEGSTATLGNTTTTVKTNADGSTTTTTSTTTTNPDGTTTTNTTTTTTKPDGTQTKETTTTVSGGSAAKGDLPPFCSWAGVVCDWIGWTKEAPDNPTTDNKVPIAEISESDILPNWDMSQQRVVFASQCPAGIPIDFTFMGSSISTTFSYDPLCQFMTMIRPFVIAASYITGAYIISGVGRGGGNDG